jgi:Fe-S cluster biogenesis protein NfuA
VRYHQDFLVEILGAITRDEFFKVAQIKNLGYHDNYVATQDQLTPIEEFKNGIDAKGYSPIAEELFKFPFVKGVFIAANFVTITKTDNVPWDFITMELREFIKTWIAEGKDVIVQMPPVIPDSEELNENRKDFLPHEIDDAIRDLLDEYVRPAVENDGGAIDYRGFDDGIVTVVLKGSCSGCPSSTATLKGGIENLLKQHFDVVKEVVAENG